MTYSVAAVIDYATDDEKYAAYVERIKASPPTKTYEPLQVGKLFADVALRKYVRTTYMEAQRLSYPRICIFAREMARGTISLPPITAEDPVHDAVGAYYGQLLEIERRILSEWYTPANGTLKQKARRVSKSVDNLKRAVERLIRGCESLLKSRGLV